MKTWIILFFLVFNLCCYSQDSKFDFKFGIGQTRLWSDLVANSIENEINYRFHKNLSLSYALTLGTDRNEDEGSTFWRGNVNLFYSPFKNTRKWDLRFGLGLARFSQTGYFTASYGYDENGEIRIRRFLTTESERYDVILTMESSYCITSRTMVGLKILRPYDASSVDRGFYLKVGFKI